MSALRVDPAWATASLLLWVRLGALFFMSPVFAGFKGPNVVLVVISLTLAGLLAAAWLPGRPMPTSVVALIVAALLELFIGALLAFGVHAAFAAISSAGRILDLQIGFGAGASFDPVTGQNAPVLAAAMSAIGVVLFFAIDGHHALLRGVAFSVAQLPPGTSIRALSLDAVVRQFGSSFTLAVVLAAPVLFALLLLELGLAVVARVLPQMNVFFVGLPIKLLVGLSLLVLGAPMLGTTMTKVYGSVFRFWDEVLR